MNFQLLKDLEDSKKTSKTLAAELKEKSDAKKVQLISASFADFKKYFEEKGFQVQAESSIISASDGDLKFSLNLENPSVTHPAAYILFDLICELPDKIEFYVALNPKKRILIPSICTLSTDSDERLKFAIQRVKKYVAETRARIKNLSNEVWPFELCNKEAQTIANFDTMYDLLTALLTTEQ